ncbi:MAG: hypothetical protein RL717_1253, partial [Pseudomonadota bacterium]
MAGKAATRKAEPNSLRAPKFIKQTRAINTVESVAPKLQHRTTANNLT